MIRTGQGQSGEPGIGQNKVRKYQAQFRHPYYWIIKLGKFKVLGVAERFAEFI